jgi:hypothetical protein
VCLRCSAATRVAPSPFEALRKFAEEWDELKLAACCQFASEEELATGGEDYNCDTCPVRCAVDDLDQDNRHAWELLGSIFSRFLVDSRTLPLMVERLTHGLDDDDFMDLMTRLSIIYDVQCPPPQKKRRDE